MQQSFIPPQAWLGLLLDRVGQQADAEVLGDILGDGSRVLLVDPQDSPFAVVRQMVRSGAANVLALTGSDGHSRLAALLQVACSLGGFRRIVVLHTAEDATALHGVPGLVLLRDCPEIRAALRDIVTQDGATAQPGAAVRAPARSTATWGYRDSRRATAAERTAPSLVRAVARSNETSP